MNHIVLNYLTQFAQTNQSYNCGVYGGGGYDTNDCIATVAGSASLAGTGTSVIIGVTGGALLVVIAVVIFVTTRRKQSKNK